FAARSFTDPPGFWPSSLARMRTFRFGLSAVMSTIGVLPMRSSALSKTAIGETLSALDGHGLFRDHAVDDAIRPQHRCVLTQRHDHVVPARFGRLRHVGR